MLGMGKQLDGPHVRDRVDDLSSHSRPRRCPSFGHLSDARHEKPDHPEIGQQPKPKSDGDPTIDRAKKERRTNQRGQRKEDHVDDLGHDIGQRPRCLHLLLRDTPREIIVKERDRLPQGPAMQPAQHQWIHVWPDQDAACRRVDRKQKRAHDQKERTDRQKHRPGFSEKSIRSGLKRRVDHETQKKRRNNLKRSSQSRRARSHAQPRESARERPLEKRTNRARRGTVRGLEGIDQIANAADHGPVSLFSSFACSDEPTRLAGPEHGI